MASSDLLRAGQGSQDAQPDPVVAELAAWGARRQRRVQARTALKHQLLARSTGPFPGWAGASGGALGSQIGRLVLGESSDPGRLASLEPTQVRAQAAADGVQLHPAVAPCLASLVGRTRVAVLTTTLGGARCGPPAPRQQWVTWPAGRRTGRSTGRPGCPGGRCLGRAASGRAHQPGGSVELRRALLGLGVSRWRHPLPAQAWATQLRARGKAKGVIATALANRASRIALAMVRDQQPCQPDRWR